MVRMIFTPGSPVYWRPIGGEQWILIGHIAEDRSVYRRRSAMRAQYRRRRGRY